MHISTDFVFDGTLVVPYGPQADHAPAERLRAQQARRREGRCSRSFPSAPLVLRTSWVYAAWGANFLRTMLRLMARRRRRCAWSPTRSARRPRHARSRACSGRSSRSPERRRRATTGPTPASPAGTTSRSRSPRRVGGAGSCARRSSVTPITTAEYPTPRAPAGLQRARYQRSLRHARPARAPHWRAELCATCLR